MFLATFAKVRTAHRTEAEKVRTAFGQAQNLVPKSPAKKSKKNIRDGWDCLLKHASRGNVGGVLWVWRGGGRWRAEAACLLLCHNVQHDAIQTCSRQNWRAAGVQATKLLLDHDIVKLWSLPRFLGHACAWGWVRLLRTAATGQSRRGFGQPRLRRKSIGHVRT